jgi:hypothetical protein
VADKVSLEFMSYYNQKLNMENNTLRFGLGLGLGAYIYEVFNNLLDHQPLSNALTDLDWKRVIFIGVFGSVISYIFYKKSDKK